MEKRIKEKLFFILKWGINKFQLFLVWFKMFFEGIKSYKYFGKRLKVFKTIVHFEEILILARLENLNPSSAGESLIAPVITNEALF